MDATGDHCRLFYRIRTTDRTYLLVLSCIVRSSPKNVYSSALIDSFDFTHTTSPDYCFTFWLFFFVTMFYSSEKNSILLTRVFLIHTLSLLCPELRGLSLVRAFSRGFGHKKLLFRWGRHRRVQCRQRFVLRPNLSDRGLIYPFSVSDVYIHRSWCVPPNAWTVPLHRIHGLGGLLAMVSNGYAHNEWRKTS